MNIAGTYSIFSKDDCISERVRNLVRKYVMCEKVKSQNQTNINIVICVDIRTDISSLIYSIMGKASFSNATKDLACFIKT